MTDINDTAVRAVPPDGGTFGGDLSKALLVLALLSPIILVVTGPRPIIAAAWFGGIALLLALVHPRVCFFLFVLSIGWYYPIFVGGAMVNPSDIAFLLTLVAVALDFLLRGSSEIRRSPFDLPFLALIAATYLSIIFAFDRGESVTPAMRIVVIYLAFRISYKMALEIGVRRIVLFYIYFVAALSLYNGFTLVMQGGERRIFGPAWLTIETFAMTALPMAAAFIIWSRDRRERIRLTVVCLVIGLAVFATQSRAPMLTIVLSLPALALFSARKVSAVSGRRALGVLFKLAGLAVAIVVVALILRDMFFESTFGRIDEFINSAVRPEGTIALRIVLWTAALKAFLINPITGIGSGNFHIVDQIVPEIRLTPVWYYIGGLSAHSVVLQYLSETGILGAGALLWLAFRAMRTAYRSFKQKLSVRDNQTSAAVFIATFVVVVTFFYMRAWTWGQDGYLMAMLFGLNAAWYRRRTGLS